jgi:hypothetical protein
MDTSGSMHPSEPMDGSREPIKRLLATFENAKALIWQERQDRIYAGRILLGVADQQIPKGSLLHRWAEAVINAHFLAEADDE